MKKTNFIILLISSILLVSTMSSRAGDNIMPQLEQGAVTCSCSLDSGKGCRADYWGSQCAPDGAGDCTVYDRNCSNNN